MQLKPVADLHEAPRKVEKQSQTCRGGFLTCSLSNALVWERSWWSKGAWPPAFAASLGFGAHTNSCCAKGAPPPRAPARERERAARDF